MIWLFSWFLLQESYFLDGTEFILTDGTTIRTAQEIDIDAHHYSWREGGEFILIPKAKVRKVNFFSLRVPGRAPKRSYKNIHQRRVNGRPAVYQKGDREYLRFRHVDYRGRSVEGFLAYNIVTEIAVVNDKDSISLAVDLLQVRPDSIIEFHFFGINGKPLLTLNVDVFDALTKRVRKRDKLDTWQTRVPLTDGFDLHKIGLVEVVSSLKTEQDR